MNAAMVERKLSCVKRRASRSSCVVAGPDGNTGVAGVPTESLDRDDEDDVLLTDNCAGLWCRGVVAELYVGRVGEVSCCSDIFRWMARNGPVGIGG